MNKNEQLRHVRFDGYELKLYATNRTDWRRQTVLAYEFGKIGEAPLFTGDDFAGSPMHSDDSDETLRCLVGFLTLKPGDTDREYFEEYTDDQLDFAKTDAERLSIWSLEDYEAPFEDVDGGES